MRELIWVDVFATAPLSGNQLAVVPDAEGLSDVQMQDIARETALSETTFVVPATRADCDVRVRVFTPRQELPMAGHPIVGTAWVLATRGAIGATAVFETGAGALAVRASEHGAQMVQASPERITAPDIAPVAEAIGVPVAATPTAAIWSTGIPQLMVPIASAKEVSAARPDFASLARLGDEQGWKGVSIYSLSDAGQKLTAEVRHFAPGVGVPEDPVTGSAAGALGACLDHAGYGEAGELRLVVLQGAGLGRPGEVNVAVRATPGGGREVSVEGRVRPVFEATLNGDLT